MSQSSAPPTGMEIAHEMGISRLEVQRGEEEFIKNTLFSIDV